MLDMSASSFEQVEVDVDVESEDEETIKQKEHEAHINKMYLAISWWFINRGWISLSQQVGDAVRRVFGSYVFWLYVGFFVYILLMTY